MATRGILWAGLFLVVGSASMACESGPDDVSATAADLTASRVVNLAIGPSVPAQDSAWGIGSIVTADGGAPTRRSGGEVIAFKFFKPDATPVPVHVSKIRLIGFSKSGRGQVLVHSFGSRPEMPSGTFDPLTKFASISADSHAQNHDGMVFLGAGDSVTFVPSGELTLTHFLPTLEAFGNDDASVDVQLEVSSDVDTLAVGFARVLVNPGENPGGGGAGGGGGGGSGGAGGGGAGGGGSSQPGGIGQCAGPGAACDWSTDCCNLSCDNHVCARVGAECSGAGASCDWSTDCCNLSCDNHVCARVGTECVGRGGVCQWSTDCCSLDCTSGRCR